MRVNREWLGLGRREIGVVESWVLDEIGFILSKEEQ